MFGLFSAEFWLSYEPCRSWQCRSVFFNLICCNIFP